MATIGASLFGSDINPDAITAATATLSAFPGVTLTVKEYVTSSMSPSDSYDVVIMNPPWQMLKAVKAADALR